MALQKGDNAPDFTLKSKNAEGLAEVKLSGSFGSRNTVLLFFPLAFTSVCTDEMCGVSQDYSAYEALNAVVYGISVDSPFAQEAFAQANNISIPLLSDFNKEASAAYGVLEETFLPGKLDMKGVSSRAAFVINKDGQIVYSWVGENPGIMPNFDEIKAALS